MVWLGPPSTLIRTLNGVVGASPSAAQPTTRMALRSVVWRTMSTASAGLIAGVGVGVGSGSSPRVQIGGGWGTSQFGFADAVCANEQSASTLAISTASADSAPSAGVRLECTGSFPSLRSVRGR